MDNQGDGAAGATQAAAMKVTHAKGLEHHLASQVTSKAPEPGAPVQQGAPVAKRESPRGEATIVRPPAEMRQGDRAIHDRIAEQDGHFHALEGRIQRLERIWDDLGTALIASPPDPDRVRSVVRKYGLTPRSGPGFLAPPSAHAQEADADNGGFGRDGAVGESGEASENKDRAADAPAPGRGQGEASSRPLETDAPD